MKQATETKLKFKQIKRRLALAHWQVVGLLESIWRITEANTPAGDIGRLTNDEIASAIEWEGNADDLIATLIEFRWIDEDPEFRLIIHNWSVHCPNYLKGAFAKNNRKFADQIVKERRQKDEPHHNGKEQQTTGDCRDSAKQPSAWGQNSAKHVPDGGAPPAKQPPPNLTKPNQTKPNHLAAPSGGGDRECDRFCFSLPASYDDPLLRAAVTDWARHFSVVKPGQSFNQLHLDNLVMHHQRLGWDAAKLERAIRFSISKGFHSIYDADPKKPAEKAAGEKQSRYKPLPPREKST